MGDVRNCRYKSFIKMFPRNLVNLESFLHKSISCRIRIIFIVIHVKRVRELVLQNSWENR